MTTGSTVDTIDAVAAPTLRIPTMNVTTGSTVETSAIAAIQTQPPAVNASAPPIPPAARNVAAAPVVTSALMRNGSTRATIPSATRM